MTSDINLESDYTVKLTGSLASVSGKVEKNFDYKAKYVVGGTTPTPPPCASATISDSGIAFSSKTYQETISATETILYSSPFLMSSTSCFTIKIIEESTANEPTWPIYLAPGSNNFQIVFKQNST